MPWHGFVYKSYFDPLLTRGFVAIFGDTYICKPLIDLHLYTQSVYATSKYRDWAPSRLPVYRHVTNQIDSFPRLL